MRFARDPGVVLRERERAEQLQARAGLAPEHGYELRRHRRRRSRAPGPVCAGLARGFGIERHLRGCDGTSSMALSILITVGLSRRPSGAMLAHVYDIRISVPVAGQQVFAAGVSCRFTTRPRRSARPEQPVVRALHGGVTFARRLAQALQVEDLDVPALLVDEIRLLQRIGDQ